MAEVLDCDLELSEYKRHHVHFRTNSLGKGMNPLIPLAIG